MSESQRAAQANVQMMLAQRDAAQAQLDLLRAGPMPRRLEAAQARLAQAQAALDDTVLVAPFDGTVTELHARAGEIAAPSATMVSVADLSRWQVETDDLKETSVVKVTPGAAVLIRADALPGVTLNGRVVALTPRSILKRGDVTYTARAELMESDPRLRWGMTMFIEIQSP
jgi:HlyD family secretion protein